MPSAPPDPGPLEPRRLREDELLRLYRHHRDGGDHRRAAEMWEHLATRSFPRVVSMVKAFSFGGGERLPRDEVDDAAQEAYLRVVAMGASFAGAEVGQFRAALHQCVHHACLDHGRKLLRHDKRRAGSLDERYEDDGDGGPYAAAIARESREREAIAADARADEDRSSRHQALVTWGIAQIANANYREVLELTFVQCLDGSEIAERLGITHDNVYQRRSRGLKGLEAILRDHEA